MKEQQSPLVRVQVAGPVADWRVFEVMRVGEDLLPEQHGGRLPVILLGPGVNNWQKLRRKSGCFEQKFRGKIGAFISMRKIIPPASYSFSAACFSLDLDADLSLMTGPSSSTIFCLRVTWRFLFVWWTMMMWMTMKMMRNSRTCRRSEWTRISAVFCRISLFTSYFIFCTYLFLLVVLLTSFPPQSIVHLKNTSGWICSLFNYSCH